MNAYLLLADAVVILHLGYVAFVVLGLLAVLLGYVMQWKWVRSPWFRITHFSMIAVVVIESLLSITCPLTTLENYLRMQGGQTLSGGSFVGRLVHGILFFDLPPSFFTVAYCAFGSLVLATFFLVPIEFARKRRVR